MLGPSNEWNHTFFVFGWFVSLYVMSSKFLHVVACVTISFFFMLNKYSIIWYVPYIPLCDMCHIFHYMICTIFGFSTQALMNIWVVSIFGFMNNAAIGVQRSAQVPAFKSYPEVELLDHTEILCLILWELSLSLFLPVILPGSVIIINSNSLFFSSVYYPTLIPNDLSFVCSLFHLPRLFRNIIFCSTGLIFSKTRTLDLNV